MLQVEEILMRLSHTFLFRSVSAHLVLDGTRRNMRDCLADFTQFSTAVASMKLLKNFLNRKTDLLDHN